MPGTPGTTSVLSATASPVARLSQVVDEVAPGVPVDTTLARTVLAAQEHARVEAAFDAFEREVFGVDR